MPTTTYPDLPRLCAAMQRSRRMLQRPREERREAVCLYAGDHWSEETSREYQPLNLLSLYVQIILRNLVAKNPRVMLSTFQGASKPIVNTMQKWANKEIVKINLANSLRLWAMDGLFSVGIMKIGLATPADSASVAWNLQAGAPFAKRVSLDDLVVDPQARDPDELQFIGHRYRVPLDSIRDDKVYHKSRKDLTASTNPTYNDGGDEKTSSLGQGSAQSAEDVEDMVDLWEVYCPRHRKILTLADSHLEGAITLDETSEPLREQAWLGPDWGPYLWLRFGIVPDNLMPKAPIQDLVGLHRDINGMLRKLIRQAQRQKNVMPVTGANAEDFQRLETTDDGFGFRCDNPQALKEANFGGPNQQNFALFMMLKDLFSFLGGNLELLGGRAAQSATATQDKMLNENASVGISDMQDTMINGAAKVLESLCWYWWHDPFKVMRTTHQIPGQPEMSIPIQVSPQERMRGSWDELDIQIDPYSMQHSTPQAKLAQLDQTLAAVAPLMGLLQQSGTVLDATVYLEKRAKYTDNADIQDIFTLREPPMQEKTGGGAEEVAGPTSTERTYNRVSSSEQTDRGAERNLMSTLMGADPGGSQNGNGQA